MNKNSKQSIRLPIYMAVAICVGVFIGSNMTDTSIMATSPLAKNLKKFRQVLTHIENDYVDKVDTDQLVEGAISSVLEELDPYSVYIPPEEFELVKFQLDGNYEGIGIEFDIFKDTIYVIAPLSGGPSEKLDIRPGDKILRIDGENVAGVGITNRKVIELLRGPRKSEVMVSILRDGEKELIDFKIVRDVVPQHSVDVAYMVQDNVGYIKVGRFANSTVREFKEAVSKLKKQGMSRLILDLTGNHGGYLQRAVQIVDEILKGKKVIVYTDGREKRYTEKHYSGKEGVFEEGAIVVMMDEGSASASEIVAGAIQDHDRGLVVGRRSYGKGLVQLPVNLDDGSQFRLTISRYYTPSGRSIQKPYNTDIAAVHKNGEILPFDGVAGKDTLVYHTSKGRIVYGGGGIMPDYLAPRDTSQSSAYLNRLLSTRSLQEFAIKYADKNKSKLEKMGLEAYKKTFVIPDSVLNELTKVAAKNGLPFNKDEFEGSKGLIASLARAYISKGIWRNEAFYAILNEQDEIYKKAVSLVDAADKMAN